MGLYTSLARLCEMHYSCDDDDILCVTCKICVVSTASHTGTIGLKIFQWKRLAEYQIKHAIFPQSFMDFLWTAVAIFSGRTVHSYY